jgi:hypothetical protein
VKSVRLIAEVELKLDEEALEFLQVGTMELVGFTEFGFHVSPSGLLNVSSEEGDGLCEFRELQRLVSAVVSAWGTTSMAAWRTTWRRRSMRIAIVVAAAVIVTTTVVRVVVSWDFIDVALWWMFTGGAGKGFVRSDFGRTSMGPSNGEHVESFNRSCMLRGNCCTRHSNNRVRVQIL